MMPRRDEDNEGGKLRLVGRRTVTEEVVWIYAYESWSGQWGSGRLIPPCRGQPDHSNQLVKDEGHRSYYASGT